MSGCIQLLSNSHSPVFLLNSCLDLFSAPRLIVEDPLSRSYRVSLPSSLTVNLPSALVYSTRPRVSVCGTGSVSIKFSGFSRRYDYALYRFVPEDSPYYRLSAPGTDLPVPVSAYGFQPPIPSGGGAVTPASPRHWTRKCRNIDRLFHRPLRSDEP